MPEQFPPAHEALLPPCSDGVCLTCSDGATQARVLELRSGAMALVDLQAEPGGAGGYGVATGLGATEEVSVALVDVAAGDLVLVHAKEAIAVLACGATAPLASLARQGGLRTTCA